MAKEKNPKCVERGRSSKRKGAVGEREAAKVFHGLFPGIEAHRGRQYHGGPGTPDVCLSVDGIHLEIKRTETFSPYKAMDQAVSDSKGDIPMVMHRKNHGEWMAFIPLKRIPELIRILATRMDIKDMRVLRTELESSIVEWFDNDPPIPRCACGMNPEMVQADANLPMYKVACSCGEHTEWMDSKEEAIDAWSGMEKGDL